MLANCPFCGSDRLDDTCGDDSGPRRFYFVYCNKCQACGPTDYDQSKAIKLWNERLTPDDYYSGLEEPMREQ